MALIKCPECGKEISDKAVQCIYCGCPIKSPSANVSNLTKIDINTNQGTKYNTSQPNATEKKGMSGCSSFIATIVVLLVIGWFLNMASCGGGSGDRTCAWCNGTGYNGNGAKNATEYVFKKTPCTHCDGTGTY